MIQRGRKSAAAMSVIRAETAFRPKPPDGLTVGQVSEWRRVVNRLPADWFPAETHACLAAYCRHTENAKRLAGLEQFPIRRNRRGFSNRQRSDSSCVLAKEAGMHGPSAFP